LNDLLGSLLGHFLDVHTALGRGDDDGLGGLPVQHDGEVIFVGDVAGLGKIDGLHLASGGAGLLGHQGIVEHPVGGIESGFAPLAELYPALVAVDEGALTAATGVDLGLDDNRVVTAQVGECGFHLAGGLGGVAFRHWDAIVLEEAFRLILVDIHRQFWFCGHESVV